MKTLVIGSTGTVGSEAVRALAERRDVHIRALVRDPSSAAAKRLPATVERCVGDVRDPASLSRALEGVRSVLYVSPHERDEEALAENVIAAAEHAGARLVFVGVHADGPNALVRWMRRTMFGALLPHYRPKLRLSNRVRHCAARPIVLCATNFFQNDELFLDAVARGSFVTPISPRGLNRVDVRDIGDAAARAMTDDTLPDGAYPVVGPRSLSGTECADILSRVWGRTVRYVGDDFGNFEREATKVLSGRKLEDILASYRALGRISLPTDPREVAATERLLGRPPRTYEAYVRETHARTSSAGRTESERAIRA